MKKVLVIGASGYVGGRLSFLLAKKGYSVTALCFPEIPKDSNWLSLVDNVIKGDITKESIIEEITKNYYDIAIHLVSLDHNDSKKAPNYVNTINVLPVWNLLESFRKKETLNRFIYFSTVHVYGVLPNTNVDELFPPKPKTAYGLTHLMAENICNYYNISSDIECINIRMTNSYGSPFFKDNSCWWLVVNDLCKSAYYDKKIILQSDGRAIRDFIHYKDVFGAVDSIINLKNYKRERNTFHLSSGQSYSIIELANLVKKEFYSRCRIDIPLLLPETAIQPEMTDERYTIDNSRLKEIDFKLSMKLEDGITELFDYFESNEC